MQIEGLIGKKIEMTQLFSPDGKVTPVTLLEVGPCVVTQIKNQEKDGYQAIQLGFGHLKPKLLKKPQAGHLKGITQKPRFFREFGYIQEDDEIKLGTKLRVSEVFSIGEKVQVSGKSKGRGFAGAIKRWGFHGGPKTHGQSDRWRAVGSIGAGTDPGRVYKGKKMPGRMGGDLLTVKGLEVLEIDTKNNILKVKGAVPGPRNSLLIIKKQGLMRNKS